VDFLATLGHIFHITQRRSTANATKSYAQAMGNLCTFNSSPIDLLLIRLLYILNHSGKISSSAAGNMLLETFKETCDRQLTNRILNLQPSLLRQAKETGHRRYLPFLDP